MTYKLIKSLLIVSVALAQAGGAAAQGPKPSPAHMEAMKRLDFLVGEWQGEGWNEMVPGQRRTSPINEMVQSKLGGSVLLVEGLGKVKVPGKDEEVVVHNALGVLSYDENAKLYRMRSYLAGG